jgi:hypothetical protein
VTSAAPPFDVPREVLSARVLLSSVAPARRSDPRADKYRHAFLSERSSQDLQVRAFNLQHDSERHNLVAFVAGRREVYHHLTANPVVH